MGQPEQRRDPRYRFQLPATLVRGTRLVPLRTRDVSLRGLFVHTDVLLSPRQLVKVWVRLPPDDDEVLLHAMVVFVASPGTPGRAPGVGLQLYDITPALQERWERFIRWVSTLHPDASGPPADDPAAVTVPFPARRRFPRVSRSLVVQVPSVGALQRFMTEDASRGGLFIRTSLDIEVGTSVTLVIVHPETGKTFDVEAEVRRRRPPPDAGVGVAFTGFDDARREEFAAFALLDEPGADEPPTFIAADDPRLA